MNRVYQLRAYKYTYSSLGKLCWLKAGVEEFPPIIQLNSVKTTRLSRRDANYIQETSFGFLGQFVPLSCEWSDIPVSS